jgi:hypothetical protein
MRSNAKRLPEDIGHREALRLTFAFHGDEVRLLFEEPVEMIVPPSAEIREDQPPAPFWYELQDRDGSALYRRAQRNPMEPWVEVLVGEREGLLGHLKTEKRDGAFALEVPDLPQAHSVVLFRWAPEESERPSHRPIPPKEVARFTLGRALDPALAAQDSTPPTTVSDVLASYRDAAEIHLVALDNAGGSGVARTLYRIDGGEEQEGMTVQEDRAGRHKLQFWSVDNAGNTEAENEVTFEVVQSSDRGRG